MDFANKCSAEAWNRKKLLFNEQVEKSWHVEGGSLKFRWVKAVKDPQKPPVTDMTIQLPVRLASQRWFTTGKAWIKVRNQDDVPVGCTLCGDDVSVTLVSEKDDYLQVDRLLTGKEAAFLFRSFVSVRNWNSGQGISSINGILFGTDRR